MLVQTKPKPPGEPIEAVQFLGDPSVHPGIFHSTDPRPHWRIGGESHGGAYDSSSSYLDIGDWIIGHGHGLRLVKPDVFERDWQAVQASA